MTYFFFVQLKSLLLIHYNIQTKCRGPKVAPPFFQLLFLKRQRGVIVGSPQFCDFFFYSNRESFLRGDANDARLHSRVEGRASF